jgi:hypothetical protein
MALTTVLAYSSPTALLACRAYTTVLAECTPTALLAEIALTTVRTSSAHLAPRAMLHPVLARPLCARASLPLRALHRWQLLLRYLDPSFDLVIDLGNRNTNLRPPNRRRPPRAHRSAASSTSSFVSLAADRKNSNSSSRDTVPIHTQRHDVRTRHPAELRQTGR